MPFDTFVIKRHTDNSTVNLNDVDRLVCERFNMTFSEEDYGHFFFTERPLNGFQESISWAGLIHVVIYHSKIEWGNRTAFNMESAMTWVCTYAIHFPESAICFFKELMEFLYQSGFYIFVSVNNYLDDSCGFGTEGFISIRKRRLILESASGLFECDADGTLLKFYPAPDNILAEPRIRERYNYTTDYYNPHVRHLIIPSGVKSISAEFFRNGCVEEHIEFPDTLISIGEDAHGCAFANSYLPDVVIPDSVKNIGVFAFGGTHIDTLQLPSSLRSPYLRQFKDSHIGTLMIPSEWENFLDISKHNGFKHLMLVSNDESWGFLRWHSTAIDKLIFY